MRLTLRQNIEALADRCEDDFENRLDSESIARRLRTYLKSDASTKDPLCKRCGHFLSHHVVRRLVPALGGGKHYYNRCDDCTFRRDYWQQESGFHEFYPRQLKSSESDIDDLSDPKVRAYIERAR